MRMLYDCQKYKNKKRYEEICCEKVLCEEIKYYSISQFPSYETPPTPPHPDNSPLIMFYRLE